MLRVEAQIANGIPKTILYDKNGNSISSSSLSDFDNPIIVITYAIKWCPPCIKLLDKIDHEFTDGQAKIYAINVEKDQTSSAVFEHAKRWKNIEVLHDRTASILKSFYNEMTPYVLFLDKNQQIVHTIENYNLDLKKAIAITSLIRNKGIYASEKIFFDKDWYPCVEDSAKYFRVSKKLATGNWMLTDYYLNGKVIWSGESLLRSPLIRQGKHMYYFENGKIGKEENYNKNQLTGIYKEYYENGQVKCQLNYLNNKTNNKFTYYFENGQVKKTGTYIDNELDGLVNYNYTNGEKWKELNYKNNKLHGKAIAWHSNGKIKYDVNFISGKIQISEDTKWTYENGQKLIEVEIKNGQINTYYNYQNGSRWFALERIDNSIEFTTYFENGQPSGKISLSDEDTFDGKLIAWYNNGQKVSEMTIYKNAIGGKSMSWYENGQVREKVNFDVDTKEYFDEKGNKVNSLSSYILNMKKGDTYSTATFKKTYINYFQEFVLNEKVK